MIRLEGQYNFGRLTLNLTQDVQILTGTDTNSVIGNGTAISIANVDVAGRTDVNVYRTHLGAAYFLTDKTFLSSDAEYAIYDYDTSLISSERFIGHLYFNYIPTGKLVLGIGGGGGIEWGDSPTPDQPFGSVNARVTYQATGKISFSATGGIEVREFGGARGEYITPVYTLEGKYLPFDGTSISISGNRQTQVVATRDSYISNSFNLPLDLSYEIDLWGRVRRGFESARAEAAASVASFYNVLLILHADVAQNYFLLRSLDAEIATVTNTVGLRVEQLQLVRSRFEGGIGNELDVARAETELATTQAEAASLSALARAVLSLFVVACSAFCSAETMASPAVKTWSSPV